MKSKWKMIIALTLSVILSIPNNTVIVNADGSYAGTQSNATTGNKSGGSFKGMIATSAGGYKLSVSYAARGLFNGNKKGVLGEGEDGGKVTRELLKESGNKTNALLLYSEKTPIGLIAQSGTAYLPNYGYKANTKPDRYNTNPAVDSTIIDPQIGAFGIGSIYFLADTNGWVESTDLEIGIQADKAGELSYTITNSMAGKRRISTQSRVEKAAVQAYKDWKKNYAEAGKAKGVSRDKYLKKFYKDASLYEAIYRAFTVEPGENYKNGLMEGKSTSYNMNNLLVEITDESSDAVTEYRNARNTLVVMTLLNLMRSSYTGTKKNTVKNTLNQFYKDYANNQAEYELSFIVEPITYVTDGANAASITANSYLAGWLPYNREEMSVILSKFPLENKNINYFLAKYGNGSPNCKPGNNSIGNENGNVMMKSVQYKNSKGKNINIGQGMAEYMSNGHNSYIVGAVRSGNINWKISDAEIIYKNGELRAVGHSSQLDKFVTFTGMLSYDVAGINTLKTPIKTKDGKGVARCLASKIYYNGYTGTLDKPKNPKTDNTKEAQQCYGRYGWGLLHTSDFIKTGKADVNTELYTSTISLITNDNKTVGEEYLGNTEDLKIGGDIYSGNREELQEDAKNIVTATKSLVRTVFANGGSNADIAGILYEIATTGNLKNLDDYTQELFKETIESYQEEIEGTNSDCHKSLVKYVATLIGLVDNYFQEYYDEVPGISKEIELLREKGVTVNTLDDLVSSNNVTAAKTIANLAGDAGELSLLGQLLGTRNALPSLSSNTVVNNSDKLVTDCYIHIAGNSNKYEVADSAIKVDNKNEVKIGKTIKKTGLTDALNHIKGHSNKNFSEICTVLSKLSTDSAGSEIKYSTIGAYLGENGYDEDIIKAIENEIQDSMTSDNKFQKLEGEEKRKVVTDIEPIINTQDKNEQDKSLLEVIPTSKASTSEIYRYTNSRQTSVIQNNKKAAVLNTLSNSGNSGLVQLLNTIRSSSGGMKLSLSSEGNNMSSFRFVYPNSGEDKTSKNTDKVSDIGMSALYNSTSEIEFKKAGNFGVTLTINATKVNKDTDVNNIDKLVDATKNEIQSEISIVNVDDKNKSKFADGVTNSKSGISAEIGEIQALIADFINDCGDFSEYYFKPKEQNGAGRDRENEDDRADFKYRCSKELKLRLANYLDLISDDRPIDVETSLSEKLVSGSKAMISYGYGDKDIGDIEVDGTALAAACTSKLIENISDYGTYKLQKNGKVFPVIGDIEDSNINGGKGVPVVPNVVGIDLADVKSNDGMYAYAKNYSDMRMKINIDKDTRATNSIVTSSKSRVLGNTSVIKYNYTDKNIKYFGITREKIDGAGEGDNKYNRMIRYAYFSLPVRQLKVSRTKGGKTGAVTNTKLGSGGVDTSLGRVYLTGKTLKGDGREVTLRGSWLSNGSTLLYKSINNLGDLIINSDALGSKFEGVELKGDVDLVRAVNSEMGLLGATVRTDEKLDNNPIFANTMYKQIYNLANEDNKLPCIKEINNYMTEIFGEKYQNGEIARGDGGWGSNSLTEIVELTDKSSDYNPHSGLTVESDKIADLVLKTVCVSSFTKCDSSVLVDSGDTSSGGYLHYIPASDGNILVLGNCNISTKKNGGMADLTKNPGVIRLSDLETINSTQLTSSFEDYESNIDGVIEYEDLNNNTKQLITGSRVWNASMFVPSIKVDVLKIKIKKGLIDEEQPRVGEEDYDKIIRRVLESGDGSLIRKLVDQGLVTVSLTREYQRVNVGIESKIGYTEISNKLVGMSMLPYSSVGTEISQGTTTTDGIAQGVHADINEADLNNMLKTVSDIHVNPEYTTEGNKKSKRKVEYSLVAGNLNSTIKSAVLRCVNENNLTTCVSNWEVANGYIPTLVVVEAERKQASIIETYYDEKDEFVTANPGTFKVGKDRNIKDDKGNSLTELTTTVNTEVELSNGKKYKLVDITVGKGNHIENNMTKEQWVNEVIKSNSSVKLVTDTSGDNVYTVTGRNYYNWKTSAEKEPESRTVKDKATVTYGDTLILVYKEPSTPPPNPVETNIQLYDDEITRIWRDVVTVEWKDIMMEKYPKGYRYNINTGGGNKGWGSSSLISNIASAWGSNSSPLHKCIWGKNKIDHKDTVTIPKPTGVFQSNLSVAINNESEPILNSAITGSRIKFTKEPAQVNTISSSSTLTAVAVIPSAKASVDLRISRLVGSGERKDVVNIPSYKNGSNLNVPISAPNTEIIRVFTRGAGKKTDYKYENIKFTINEAGVFSKRFKATKACSSYWHDTNRNCGISAPPHVIVVPTTTILPTTTTYTWTVSKIITPAPSTRGTPHTEYTTYSTTVPATYIKSYTYNVANHDKLGKIGEPHEGTVLETARCAPANTSGTIKMDYRLNSETKVSVINSKDSEGRIVIDNAIEKANKQIKGKILLKVFVYQVGKNTGSSQTESNTSSFKSTIENNLTINNVESTELRYKDDIKFFPYVRMQSSLDGGKRDTYYAILGDYVRKLPVFDVIEVGWSNTSDTSQKIDPEDNPTGFDSVHNLQITSKQWSTHSRSIQALGKNQVLPGGAVYNLSTGKVSRNSSDGKVESNKNDQSVKVGVRTYGYFIPNNNYTTYKNTEGGMKDIMGYNRDLVIEEIQRAMSYDANNGDESRTSQFKDFTDSLTIDNARNKSSGIIGNIIQGFSQTEVEQIVSRGQVDEDTLLKIVNDSKRYSSMNDNNADVRRVNKANLKVYGNKLSALQKYWLKETNPSSNTNNIDRDDADTNGLDVTNVKKQENVYTVRSTVGGYIIVEGYRLRANGSIESVEAVKFDASRGKVPSKAGDFKTYSISDGVETEVSATFINDILETNGATHFIDNYLASISVNGGDGHTYMDGSEEVSTQGWYNEAFDGISVLRTEYVMDLGFYNGQPADGDSSSTGSRAGLRDSKSTAIRSAALNIGLIGKQDNKADLYNFGQYTDDPDSIKLEKMRTSMFITRPMIGNNGKYGEVAIINKDSIGVKNWNLLKDAGGVSAVPIKVANMATMYHSRIFYIPNATVMDLN